MNRTTNLKDMDAPPVGSGNDAKETVLKGTATYPLPSEKEANEMKEYKTPAQPKGKLGGRNQT